VHFILTTKAYINLFGSNITKKCFFSLFYKKCFSLISLWFCLQEEYSNDNITQGCITQISWRAKKNYLVLLRANMFWYIQRVFSSKETSQTNKIMSFRQIWPAGPMLCSPDITKRLKHYIFSSKSKSDCLPFADSSKSLYFERKKSSCRSSSNFYLFEEAT